MSHLKRVVLTLLAVLASALPLVASAAETVSGSVVSVDAQGGRIVIKDKSKMTNRSFQVPKNTQISLDGKTALLNRVEAGQSVTVFFTGNVASRLIVRAEKKDEGSAVSAKPMPMPTPKSEPKVASIPKTPVRPATTTKSAPAATANTGTSWSQFRGPLRDNISRETGLLKQWPEDGPQSGWSVSGIGEGYSSVSISDGKVFTMGNIGDDEMVIALDLASGDKLWSTRSGRAYREGQGNGPRGTPTVDADRVYALGANGDLVCLDTATGNRRWHLNILSEFAANNIVWGISESVLIDGERLICTPGGRDATMVALNKMTGKLMWRSQVPSSPQAAYSSAIAIEVGGVRQYVNFTHGGVVGVRASDGAPMWGQRESSNGTANCSSAIFENNSIFTASGYGTGGALFRLTSRGGQTVSEMAYSTREMKNHHGGMVALDGYLYGCDEAVLTCLELRTGKVAWQNRSVGKGSLTMADGRLYVRSEQGPIALVEVNSQQYIEHGRFQQPQRSGRPSWSHPVVAEGKLFLRDMDRLLTYQVQEK